MSMTGFYRPDDLAATPQTMDNACTMARSRWRTARIVLFAAAGVLLAAYSAGYVCFRLNDEIVHYRAYAGDETFHRVEATMPEGPEIWVMAMLACDDPNDFDRRLEQVWSYYATRRDRLSAFFWPARKAEGLFWEAVD
jgi:hypothetical protein